MSIVIKGIEMPTNCQSCPCSDDESRFCRAANEYIPMLGKPNFCPLVETEDRKTGRWIEWTKGRAMCPFCKKEPVAKGWETFIYCPHCGARMEVEE